MKLPSRSTSSTSLSELMAHRSRRDQFIAYLREKEKSIENLDFVLWFEDYRSRFHNIPPAQQHIEIENVLAIYFDNHSSSELNLDEECKLNTLRRVRECVDGNKSIPPSIFQHTYHICCQLLENSSIPAFISFRKSKRTSIRTLLGFRGSYSISRTSSSSSL